MGFNGLRNGNGLIKTLFVCPVSRVRCGERKRVLNTARHHRTTHKHHNKLIHCMLAPRKCVTVLHTDLNTDFILRDYADGLRATAEHRSFNMCGVERFLVYAALMTAGYHRAGGRYRAHRAVQRGKVHEAHRPELLVPIRLVFTDVITTILRQCFVR